MISPKVLGGVQLVGALAAGYLGWSSANWGVVVLCVVFLVMSIHHLME